MLLSLSFALVYIFLDQRYRADDRLPLADFTLAIIWTIFWLAGSSAWAQGVSNLRSQTSWQNVAKRLQMCTDTVCSEDSSKL